MKKILVAMSLMMVLTSCQKSEEAKETAAQATPAKAGSEGVPVKVMKVEPTAYREFGEYVGQINAIKEARLSSYAGGRVVKINKDRGERVKKGERLCSIEGDKYKTMYDSAQLAEKLAKEKLDRTKRHLEQGTASRTQLDRSRMEFLQSKQSRLEAEKTRDGALCISPFTGIVVDRKIELYDETSPGQATFYIADTSKVKVTIGIPETEIDGYEVGNEAFLTVNAQKGDAIRGRVVSLAQKVDSIQRTFLMDLEFDNGESLLKAGMTGRIKVLRFDLADKLVVPTEAILVLTNQKAVMVVKDGKALKKQIVVNSSNETQTLISQGIEFGDELVVKGQMQAVDGAAVEIIR